MPKESLKPTLPSLSLTDKVEGKEPELKLPPPPEPPEYYPGYKTEVESYGKSVYQADKRVKSAYSALVKTQERGSSSSFMASLKVGLAGIFPPLGLYHAFHRPLVPEEYDKALAEAQAELDAGTVELQSAEWRLQVLHTLPAYLSSRRYTVKDSDDILALIPNDTITDSDRQWLQSALGKLGYLENSLPADFEGTVDEVQQKILDEILAEPKLEFKAVHNLTVEELMRSFQPYAIELPEGLSVEDVRSVMSQQGLEDEAAEKELSDYLLERANQWAIETDRLNLVRAGLLQAESPSLTPMEFVKLLFVQPLMAGIELLDKYFNILPRPLASAAIIGVHNLFKTPDDTMAGRMSSLYQYYRSMGESDWSAYAKALNEVDVPWYVRIGVEVVFDPTSYIGLGIATAAASKIGSALSRVGLGFIGARIGPFVGSIENGFIRGADAAFQVGKEIVLSPVKGSFWLAGAGYQIPKTMTMMSRNFARQSSMNFKAVLDRTYPNVRNLQGLTAKDIRETAEACVDAALTRPSEGYDLMVKTGAELMEFNYLDASVAKKLIKGIADDAMELDTVRLARINDDVLNMFSGQSPQITAGNILTKLGLEHTDNTVSTLLSRISSIKDDIVDGALNAFKSDSPVDQLIGMFNHLEAVRYSNLASPISAHMTQAGQTISWVSRVSDRVMTSMQLVWLERKVIMPFARWNLLFANFGPFNFLENMQRSFLGGAEIMYPRAYGGVAETNRLFRGLTNAPYELQMAERGINRMEMALIDPKTGSTSTFHGGKIPFVTRGVRVGGVDIGKTINIRGIDHKITDFQAYNDMWEYLTTVQRSYDYQVHYMKALPEVAPVEMRQITEAVIGRRNQLKSISKFSASDVRDIERTILQDATVGPDEVLFHSKIDSLEFERRQISKELGKTFDKCTDVRSATKVGIRDEVLDGSIFSDVDGRVAAYVEAERELNIASLVNQTDALQKEAADFAINPPKNLDEFLGDMDNITAMQDAIGERIHDYRRLTELRSHKLKPGKEVDDFHTGSNKLLGEFMEQSQEQLDNIVANMQKFSKELPVGFKMTEPQQAVVDSLADIYRLETRNILSTRSRLAEIEAKIPRTPPKSRDTRFWQQQRAEKAFIWDEHEVNARRLRNLRWNNSRYFLNSIGKPSFVPDVIPPVVGELTPSHVAYLFGVTGDDVYRGLTRMHHHATIRPREDFIDYVKNQANAYAMKSQKTAADIGFTDEAIGEVYDQLWRNLGLDPMALAPDSPTVMQMEEIRQELTRLNVAVRMDETDIAKWRQYVQGVSDDLREMPMYKAAARVIPVTPEVTPTAIPKKVATADWLAKKESAMAKARTQHELAYPTYDDANIIDETMRAIFPFWCTPEDTKILTKVGWKLHTELSLGEDVLTVNPKTLTTEWQPVQEIAVFDYDDELMVIPAKGKDIKFTPNHRWLVVNKWSGKAKIKRGYELKEVSDFIPRALPHRFSEESVLSPRLAAILGWIVTEGYLQSPATQRPFFLIYQHRKNYVSEIEAATGSKAYPRSKENDPDNMVIRVSATDTAEILKVYSGKEDLPKLVSNISKESAQAMWKAMMLAEGSFGQAYNGTAVDEWSQLPGPVSDAFQMLSVLLGKAITVGKHNGTLDKVYFSNNRQPYQVKQCRRMRKEHYTGKVWCPVTANGTWFANFNGSIIPTGNTYEAFRWKWIPRTMMRTPGTMTGLARYMDYTDGGYIPVPGTDLQLNPLRGSIWMGGLRRFYLRDFPEYYDTFPGMEFIDYIGRAGFYPGIHVMGPIVAFGAATGKPELSEVAPTWVKTGLSALRALSPEHIGKVLDVVYPDRFRDFQTMLTLGEEGYDADEIWRKKKQGFALTEEEEKLWLRAEARANGLKGILMEQTGIFRIRPAEYERVRREMRLAIEEATGVPVATQERIDRLFPVTGKRFSDYYKLDVLQQKLLYGFEAYRRWQGITTPLYPSSWQLLEVRIRDYYEELEKNSHQARLEGVYEDGKLVRPSIVDLNQQLVSGEIGPDQWRSMRSEIQSSLAEVGRALGESPAYKGVPKTLEEREAWLQEKGIPLPTYGADQELLWYYYELEPEYQYNWESGRDELDFETYYAKVDILLESLDDAHRQRLLDRIQLDWTPMERLYWTVSREFFRPYRNIRSIVLEQYTEEQKQQIRRFEVARGEEREALKEIIGPDGNKLISGFNTNVRKARQSLRYVDPELDAWLYFFGTTDTFITETGKENYERYKKQYLTQSMVQ